MTRVILSDRSMTAPQPGTPIITTPTVADNFNRASGPLGATPVGDRTWSQRVAMIQIINDAAQATELIGGTGALWEVNTGLETGTFYLTALTNDAQLYVRGTENSSGYLFGRGGENLYRLSIRNTGSNTSITTAAAPSMTRPEQLSVVVHPNGLMICKVNGVSVIEHIDTTHNGTRAGIRFSQLGGRADDFAAYR